MGVWAWLLPGDKVWKIVSDYEKGTISVYDEKGELALEKRGLSKEVISAIETNFLDVVATNLTNEKSGEGYLIGAKKPISADNPMYA